MIKKHLMPFLIFGLLVAGLAAADHPESPAEAVLEQESVSLQDLEVSEPAILPGSPFYFFKTIGRGFQSIFTFNPVKRAELELRFADEKLAEAKKLAEESPERTNALDRALENYQSSQERLRFRLEALQETSENPNVDKLLDKLADRAVKHEKLFDELKNKFEDNAGLKTKLEDVEKRIAESAAGAAAKDEAANFAARFERVLTESRGSALKHIRSVEIIDGVIEKAPEEARRALERLRDDFSERLKKDIDSFSKDIKSEELGRTIEKLPGDIVRHSVILEEIRQKSGQRVVDALKEAGKVYEEFLKEREGSAEHALRQIKTAEEILEKLENRMREAGETAGVVRNIFERAAEHLMRAKAVFEEKKFGEAFGQARSAEVLARSALRMLEEERPDAESLKEILLELEAKIMKHADLVNARKFSPEVLSKIERLLADAKTHLGFARDSLAKNDVAGVKLHIGHVRGFLGDLARLIETHERAFQTTESTRLPAVTPKPAERTDIVCTQEYAPVCGADGKTYSNACHAKAAGIEVKLRGECPRPETKPTNLEPTTRFPSDSVNILPESATVVINEKGLFDPQEIKIRRGSKVIWVNKSSLRVWPASAAHPTHLEYPGFDARRGLDAGESYSFVFERAGSWKYHDHLHPDMTGVVHVVE